MGRFHLSHCQLYYKVCKAVVLVAQSKTLAKQEVGILFEDEHLLAVNKPAGVTVIPERHGNRGISLQEMLEPQYGKLWVVHRIDRGTSGVVVFARSAEAHRHLNTQFEQHSVEKKYLAVAQGRFAESEMTIDAPIAQHPSGNGKMVVHYKGKPSLSLVKVQQQFRSAALLQVQIKTGRTHQIRVHLQSIGHPLLVDEAYGGSDGFLLSRVKRNYKAGEEERPLISRLTLHAHQLRLQHPHTEAELLLEAPLPKDLRVLIEVLQKYDA